MSSLVLSALLICFLIPIHGITACQLALRKLSAADVNTPADPAPSPPNHCTHGTGGLSPQNKGVGGFCGGRATKHSRYNGESGRQVQLAHTLNCSLFLNKAEPPHSNGVFGDAVCSWHYGILREFLLLSPLFLSMLPDK